MSKDPERFGKKEMHESLTFGSDIFASDAIAQLSEYIGESDDGIGNMFPVIKGFQGKIRFLDPDDGSKDKIIIVGILGGKIVFKVTIQVDQRGIWHIIENIVLNNTTQQYERALIYDSTFSHIDGILLLKQYLLISSSEVLARFSTLQEFRNCGVRFIQSSQQSNLIIEGIQKGKIVFKEEYTIFSDGTVKIISSLR